MSESQLSPESLAELELLVAETIASGQSLDWLVRQIRDFGKPWGWHEAFEYHVRGRRYARAQIVLGTCSRILHQSRRQKQLLEAGFRFIIYQAWHNGECEAHQRFDGLALPPDHPFWEIWAPPNGLLCQCSIGGSHTENGVRRMRADPDKQLPAAWDDPRFGPDPDFYGYRRPLFERIVERALLDQPG